MNLEHMSLTQLRRELDRLRAFRSPSTADLRRENRVAQRIAELEFRRAALRETGVLASRRMLAELDAEPMVAGGMR